MDHSCEAVIGFVGSQSDAFELFEPAEEALDQVTPFVHLHVDGERCAAARMLGDDDFGAARIEIGDDGVCVEGLVGDQGAKGDTVNEWRNANRVEAMSWQQLKAHEVAQGIGQRQNLSRHAAFGTADGLTRSPPFAPCPWRWTLTMVASTMAYSMSGSSETAFEQPAPVRLPGPEILPV
jgi:hypothetical protein